MKIVALHQLASVSAVGLHASSSASASALLSAVGHRNVTHMEALVQSLAEESFQEPGWKFDEDIKKALHSIRDIFVTSIQVSLKDQHRADQEHFSCHTKNCFGDCRSALDQQEAECAGYNAKCDGYGVDHETCRKDVFELYRDMGIKCGKLHCFEVPDPDCPTEDCLCPDLDFCHTKGLDGSCKAKAGECKGKILNAKGERTNYGQWLQSMTMKYQAAYTEWAQLYSECKTSYHLFLTTDMSCDASQKKFEKCLCEKNKCEHTSCDTEFQQCNLQCWERYEELVTEKECLEKDRKIDWSATKKIECYVDVLLHDYTKDELLKKCGTTDCINVAREEDYKHCATICPEVDHDGEWPTVLSAEPFGIKIDNHAFRTKVSDFLLGDAEYKCDFNGPEVFTRHRGGVERDEEGRCTEHLDIDYQIPECAQCGPRSPPVCDEAFLKKWYFQFDDPNHIDCISDCCSTDGKTCFDDIKLRSSSDGLTFNTVTVKEHSHAWAFNRCECTECTEGYPVYASTPDKYSCGKAAHTLSKHGIGGGGGFVAPPPGPAPLGTVPMGQEADEN